jgi:hypothetical protein
VGLQIRSAFVIAAPAPLEKFRAIVFADPALQQELRAAADRASFVALTAARAAECGCALAAADIEAALDAGARAWMRQRIEP